MTKNLRAVKTSIIMGILLLSLFAVFMPSSSAGLLKSSASLKLEPANPEELNQKVVPLSGSMQIQLKIGYLVSGLFSAQAIGRFSGTNQPAQISLSVEEPPGYCTASIEPNIVSPAITNGWSYDTSARLLVSFKESVPAMTPVNIKIKMHSIPLQAVLYEIKEATDFATITINPAFLPIIDATARNTYAEVSPGKIAEFQIDLENLGNAKTEFIFNIVDLPKGWTASIPAATLIGSAATGDNPKKTITLSVTPPYGFGYHDELVTIKISIKGQYFAGGAQGTLETQVYQHNFQVRSRGFSTPGFEAVFVIFALVGIAFFVKKRQKIKNN